MGFGILTCPTKACCGIAVASLRHCVFGQRVRAKSIDGLRRLTMARAIRCFTRRGLERVSGHTRLARESRAFGTCASKSYVKEKKKKAGNASNGQ